jgi:ubiquinone/menaquinone biosynthesis C-methylase UbiE
MAAIAIAVAGRAPRIVDVGASNGWRAALISDAVGGTAVAVDPSREALADGRTRYPRVRFCEGVASDLPLERECADLVIVSFVLHWLARPRLMAAFSEIDRILVDGGYLLLGDFLPEMPTRVAYHHRRDCDIWTYKQDYARAFVASGLYTETQRVIIDHRTGAVATAAVAPHDRCAISVLRKNLEGQYRAREPRR